MTKPPTSEQVQVNFRMPADLKARIEEAAQRNGRSTTAEIVATLDEHYPVLDIDVNTTRSWEWVAFIDSAPDEQARLDRLHNINEDLRFSSRKNRWRVRQTEADGIREYNVVLLPHNETGDYTDLD